MNIRIDNSGSKIGIKDACLVFMGILRFKTTQNDKCPMSISLVYNKKIIPSSKKN